MRTQWRVVCAAALALAAVSGCERGGTGGSKGGGKGAETAEVKGDSGPPPGQLPQGVSAELGEQGRGLYRQACVMCHGEAGQGTQLAPSVVEGGGKPFEQIVQIVTAGAPRTERFPVAMPPKGNGKFSDEQIRAVSAYTYSLAHK